MTFKICGQRLLAAAASAGLGLGLISCGQSNTIDYFYLLSAKNSPGQINVFYVDSITGALTQSPHSPFTSGGDNPVGIATAPDGNHLYVVNRNSNTVVSFTVQSDATPAILGSPVTTPGSQPLAVVINPAGTQLFVLDYYGPGYSDANPGPGAVIVYPVSSNGSLGSPVTQTASSGSGSSLSVGMHPSALAVAPSGNAVYVTDQLLAASGNSQAGQGGLDALAVNASGVLTPVAGSPYGAGVTPSSLALHPIGQYLYVTDSAQNQIIGFHVNSDASLLPFVGGPIATGTFPDSITVEPRGLYLYVADRFSNSNGGIQSYSISAGTGIPASTGTYPTDTFPQCILVEPALGRFVYTADFKGLGTTGYQLNPNTGTLSGTENSPYPGVGVNTCVAAIPHNNHTTIHVQGVAGS